MVLVLYVRIEKLTHRDPRVLSLDVVLLVVTRKPCPKCVILSKPCVVYILKVDRGGVEDIGGLCEPLVHVGHIIVLVCFNHVSDLFVTNEH